MSWDSHPISEESDQFWIAGVRARLTLKEKADVREQERHWRSNVKYRSIIKTMPSAALTVFVLASVVGLNPAFGADQGPLVLGWDDLKNTASIEDPFRKLTRTQLLNLSICENAAYMQENVPKAFTEKMAKEAEEARSSLIEQGIDIEGTLAKREEIKKIHRRRAVSTNPDLDGKQIRIPGYLLPLEYDGKKVTEFLLVPWVGACIHTPAPPSNQIVYVTLEQAFEVRSQFEPVWVTGKLAIDDVFTDLFLVDGSAEISIGYLVSDGRAERYEELGKQPVPRRGDAH